MLNVETFSLEGDLDDLIEKYVSDWPSWIVVRKAEITNLEITAHEICTIVAYIPGMTSVESTNRLRDLGINSISEEFIGSLFEVLPKLTNLQECRICFESCDVEFTRTRFTKLIEIIPKTHLKYLELRHGSISDVRRMEFEESFIPSLKLQFLPETKVEISQFKTSL